MIIVIAMQGKRSKKKKKKKLREEEEHKLYTIESLNYIFITKLNISIMP